MYSTLVQCATGEILPFRIYGFYPIYPIGNTTNDDKMVEMPFLVLTLAMREKVESRKMQFVQLDVIFSNLGLCAAQEIFPSRQ